MAYIPPKLFIPVKEQSASDPSVLPTAFRAIEHWVSGLSIPGITQITSTDGSVTITNPFGPTTNLHVAGGGGGAAYASLTGPGYTATPGDLTQTGGLTINQTAGTMGFQVIAPSGVSIQGGTSPNLQSGYIGVGFSAGYGIELNSAGPIYMHASGARGITVGDESSTGYGLSMYSQIGSVTIEGQATTTTPASITLAHNITSTAPTGFVVNSASGTITLNSGNSTGGVGGTSINLLANAGNINIQAGVDPTTTPNSTLFLLGPLVEICMQAGKLIFFPGGTATAAAKQSVSGSRGGNAALTSLITALANYNLITDASTP